MEKIMGYEDEDFIVRQAKQTGEILGGILGKKDAETILTFGNEAKTSDLKEQDFDFRLSTYEDIPDIGTIINQAKQYLKDQ